MNERQLRFCNLYAMKGDWSATKCAIEAGYSPKNASSAASHLLSEERVKKAIADVQAANPNIVMRANKRERMSLRRVTYQSEYRMEFDRLLMTKGVKMQHWVMNNRHDIFMSSYEKRMGRQMWSWIHQKAREHALAVVMRELGVEYKGNWRRKARVKTAT